MQTIKQWQYFWYLDFSIVKTYLSFLFWKKQGNCFEQGVPWHSDNYRVWIHSETCTWRDKNIQSNALYREVLRTQLSGFESSCSHLNSVLSLFENYTVVPEFVRCFLHVKKNTPNLMTFIKGFINLVCDAH